jgi:hypothetical protein
MFYYTGPMCFRTLLSESKYLKIVKHLAFVCLGGHSQNFLGLSYDQNCNKDSLRAKRTLGALS